MQTSESLLARGSSIIWLWDCHVSLLTMCPFVRDMMVVQWRELEKPHNQEEKEEGGEETVQFPLGYITFAEILYSIYCFFLFATSPQDHIYWRPSFRLKRATELPNYEPLSLSITVLRLEIMHSNHRLSHHDNSRSHIMRTHTRSHSQKMYSVTKKRSGWFMKRYCTKSSHSIPWWQRSHLGQLKQFPDVVQSCSLYGLIS